VTDLVFDASAAIAIFREEPEAVAVQRIVRETREAGGSVLVPDHFWLEVVNVLRRRYRYKIEDLIEAIRLLDELQMETVSVDRPLLLLAIDAMLGGTLSGYDAAYLAVAKTAQAQLLTLDGGLAAAAGNRAALVAAGGHRLAESPFGYGPADVEDIWHRQGQLLARLRERALRQA
jgi:predicted nucleic acid-binding protein